MSAWTELACLLASIFLVSSIGVCLKCFPLLVCQCLSSGPLGFLLKRDNRSLSQLLPSVSEQSYSKGTEVFLPICITCLSGWFTLFLVELVPNFLHSLEDANWLSSLGSSRILFQNLSDLLLVFCCKIYQISFWFFFHTIFYQDCTSCQLASKDTNRSWVGSRDSKGDGQYYLDYSI